MAIATGFPTYKQIIAEWKKLFDIEITEQSEKEWRKANRTRIEVKKQELIESGEIEVPIISDKVLADNMNVLVTENCRLNSLIRQKVTKILKDFDPDKMDEMDMADQLRLKNKMAVFEVLMNSFDKTTNAIVKSFEKMSDLSGRAKLVDAKAGRDEEALKLLGAPDDEDFDPTAVEISDEDRAKTK